MECGIVTPICFEAPLTKSIETLVALVDDDRRRGGGAR